ncbi:MAG: hypothetical protein CSA35_01090 [Dethiosulfovibrio peptidovorans]|nr:MAG: hypothetical protein CSA35_01090 [Dethiosulfovibrio peptidovorans]
MEDISTELPFKVMIANDSRLERRILVDALEPVVLGEYRLVVDYCSRGDEALKYILEQRPNMVFLDWVMPGMDGPEICAEVRKHSDREDLWYCYIFMTTSMKGEEALVHGLCSGADDFVAKPFHSEELKARIRVGLRLLDAYRKVLRQKEDIARLSRIDSLTGILNRSSILVSLDRTLRLCRSKGNPLVVGICDVDHFKMINDTYGHQAGDFVLQKLGNLFEKLLGGFGHIGRYGGDEFLFILPKCDELLTTKLITRFYDLLGKEPFDFNGIPVVVTLSCGLAFMNASLNRELASVENLIKVADDGLYEAKRRGRGRACSLNASEWRDVVMGEGE